MARENLHKKERLENMIKQELNQFLRGKTSDPRLTYVSVTQVQLNSDYHYGKVYWGTYDLSKRGDAKRAMEGACGRLRSKLAKVLPLYQVPKLEYLYDGQLEAENHIMNLLKNDGHVVQP